MKNREPLSLTERKNVKEKEQQSFIVQLQIEVKQFLIPLLKQESKLNLCVGFSGGLDSTVLLHILTVLRNELAFTLEAVHINHALSEYAGKWEAFCVEQCRLWETPLHIIHVHVDKTSGKGIEAEARTARYLAYQTIDKDYIVLAHHQNDQAETLLLQLFRGSGLKGLSGMAPVDHQRQKLRPLLEKTRDDLSHYAKLNGLQWIEDDSNHNIQFDRNYCRHQILPFILKRFPASIKTLQRTAHHIAEAQFLLTEMAKNDAQSLLSDNRLSCQKLSALGEIRGKNILRYWIESHGITMPSATKLKTIYQQLTQSGNDRSPIVSFDKKRLRKYRDWAFIEQSREKEFFMCWWQGEKEIILPQGGKLVFIPTKSSGIAMERLKITTLQIQTRQGGEKFKPYLMRPTKLLKTLLQECNIPPWQRWHIPLIYFDDQLIFVPNVGITPYAQCQEGETGLVIQWIEA